jgi:hypothetical protein
VDRNTQVLGFLSGVDVDMHLNADRYLMVSISIHPVWLDVNTRQG